MSIFDDAKYNKGTEFKLSTAKHTNAIERFNKQLEDYGITVDGDTIFIKQTQDDYNGTDNTGVISLSKTPTATLYAQIKGDNRVFKIETTKRSDNMYIKHSDTMTWNENTLEVAQCLGVFFDANESLQSLLAGENNHIKYVNELKGILNSVDNLNPKGQTSLNDMLSSTAKLSLGDLILTYSLAAGMSDFVKDILNSGDFNYVVHADIKEIYKAEKENPLLSTDGSKDPTPDVVVSTHSAGELVASLSTNQVTFDEKGICKTSDGIKFVMVSLKKVDGGAQLGKIFKPVKDKYGLASFDDMLNAAILSEGWLSSTLTKSKEVVIKLTRTVKDTIQKISAKFGRFENRFKNLFIRQVNKERIILFKNLMKELGSPITESVNLITEDSINSSLSLLPESKLKIIVDKINNGLKDIEKIAKSFEQILFKGPIVLKLEPKLSDDDRYKLFANYVAVRVLSKQLLPASKGSLKELENDIIGLLKEMYFGYTVLPVYKVYGKDPKGHSYEYLGAPGAFTEKIQSTISNSHVPIMGIHISYNQEPYYTINSYFCLGSDDSGEIIYSSNRLGTNRSGAFSFNYEGSNVLTYDKIIKKFK